jgi:hypothetical protein
MKQAEIYPFQASDNKKLLYDKIATALNDLISDVTDMLDISSSNVRISCDGLWSDDKNDRGLVVQIKSNNNTWKKPWPGNNYIIQTLSGEGVTIKAHSFDSIDIDGFRDKELRGIFDKACELELDKHVAEFNKKLAKSLTSSELKLIAPNTPIIITGEN